MIAKVIAHGPDRGDGDPRCSDGALRRATHPRRHHQPSTCCAAILRRRGVRRRRACTPRCSTSGSTRWTAPVLDDRAGCAARGRAGRGRRTRPRPSQGAARASRPAYRNVPSQPRTRTYERGGEETTVSLLDRRGGRLSDLEGVTVVDGGSRRGSCSTTTASRDDVRGRRSAPGSVDVDGPDGSLDVRPGARRSSIPADVVAEGSLLAPMPAAVISVAVDRRPARRARATSSSSSRP